MQRNFERCLNSNCLQKNYNKRIEILLVNDGATDNSLSIINDSRYAMRILCNLSRE